MRKFMTGPASAPVDGGKVLDPEEHRRYGPDAQTRVGQLQAELREKELLIELLEHQRVDMERRIEEIYASNSWRLGAPFRAVSFFAKRVARALRHEPLVPSRSSSPVPSKAVAAVAQSTLPREDTFVIYRIIGNDLPPRHRKGQSLENLRFILDHEPSLPGCEKVFVLNRMVDPHQESMAERLLNERGYRYFRIPFVAEEYRRLELDIGMLLQSKGYLESEYVVGNPGATSRLLMALYRHKINYVMNVNHARNAALSDGRSRAKWVLPWDGNCFLAADAWDDIRRGVAGQPENRYFLVPMTRMKCNEPLVSGGIVPRPVEEPQVIFRTDAGEQFNPDIYYGHRDKVELLWRLGAKGAWSSYRDDPWDPPRQSASYEAAHVGKTGWVARLFSGRGSLEKGVEHSSSHRAIARSIAVMEMLRRLDQKLVSEISPEHKLMLKNFEQRMKGRI